MLKQKGKYKILKQCKIFWPFFFVEMLKKQGGIKIYKNEKNISFFKKLGHYAKFYYESFIYMFLFFFFMYKQSLSLEPKKWKFKMQRKTKSA